MMASNSIGGQTPESGLASAAMVGAFDPGDDAIRSCSRAVHERRSTTFFCRSLEKLSMAALSLLEPTLPFDPTMR